MSLVPAKAGFPQPRIGFTQTPERILAREEGSRRREGDVLPSDGEIRLCRPRIRFTIDRDYCAVTTHFSPRYANFLAGLPQFV